MKCKHKHTRFCSRLYLFCENYNFSCLLNSRQLSRYYSRLRFEFRSKMWIVVQCWCLDYVSIISQKPIIVNTSSRQSTSNLMVETVNQTSSAHVVYQVYCHDHSCTYINYKSIIKVFWWEIIYVMWAGWLLCRGGRTCFLNSITNIHKLSLQIQIQPPPLSFSLISFSKQ